MPGTISAELVQRVRVRCCDPAAKIVTDAEILSWLSEAEDILASSEAPDWLLAPLHRIASRALVPGEEEQSLPPDFLRERHIMYAGKPGRRVALVAARSLVQNPLTTPNEERIAYGIFGTTLRLYGQAPEPGDTLRLYYIAKPMRQRGITSLQSDGSCVVPGHGLTTDHVGMYVYIDSMVASSGNPNTQWKVAEIISSTTLRLEGGSGAGTGGTMYFVAFPQVWTDEDPLLGPAAHGLMCMWAASRVFEALGEPQNAALERTRFYKILNATIARTLSGRPSDRRAGEPVPGGEQSATRPA